MMPKHQFNTLLNTCRSNYKQTVIGFQERGSDFDSKIYAEGVRNHMNTVTSYLPEKAVVADLGCGKGHLSAVLAEQGFNMFGFELPETRGEFINPKKKAWQLNAWKWNSHNFNSQFCFTDISRLPVKREVFDGVLLYAVLEHVSSVDAQLDLVLKRIGESLKTGGYLFIFRCPRRGSYAEKLAAALKLPRHDKLFSDGELFGLLTKRFCVVEFARTDMVLAFPPGLKFWNQLSGLLLPLDMVLLRSPLSCFSHHLMAVCRKEQDR